MRDVFFKTLIGLAKFDKDIILLTNDVGYSFFDEFIEKYPNQFINCGVMEQTIMGIASGLALAGKKPYVYSMINFVTMRPYEQLRNDICYQNANVKIIGVKGSVHYKFLGTSHNIVEDEDKKILSVLPNIKLHFPKTKEMTEIIVKRTYKHNGPDYIRV